MSIFTTALLAFSAIIGISSYVSIFELIDIGALEVDGVWVCASRLIGGSGKKMVLKRANK